MQNRYAGDIGDYGKIGLLRMFADLGFKIGINWYLTPDESHNEDGRITYYLEQERFRKCDPALWDALRQIVHSGNRSVAALQSAQLLQAKYYDKPLDFSSTTGKGERRALRSDWHKNALDMLHDCDLVFCDPDNGLIVPSAKDTKKSNKFVLLEELVDFYQSGSSVIYYQHQARRPDEFYFQQHQQLTKTLGFEDAAAWGLKFFTASCRYYFFLVHPEHTPLICHALSGFVESNWSHHFSILSGFSSNQ